jgi:hypothetical protein
VTAVGRAHEAVAEHLRLAFIGTFGATGFEVWRGKDGVSEHSAAEVGDAMAVALAPLLSRPDVAAAISDLRRAGALARVTTDPGPP